MAERADAEPASIRWSYVRHWGDAAADHDRQPRGPGARRAATAGCSTTPSSTGSRRRCTARSTRASSTSSSARRCPGCCRTRSTTSSAGTRRSTSGTTGAWRGPARREGAAGGRPRALGRVRRTPSSGSAAALTPLARGEHGPAPGDGAGALRRRPPRLRRRAGRSPAASTTRVHQLTVSPLHNQAPHPIRVGFRIGWSRLGAAVHRAACARLARAAPTRAGVGQAGRARSSATRSASSCSTGREARFRLLGDRARAATDAAAGARPAAHRGLTGWGAMTQAGPGSRPAADPGPPGHLQHPPRRGGRRAARPAPAGARCSPRPTPTSSACRRSTGYFGAAQRGRRPGAAALPGAGHAAGVGTGDRRAAAGAGAARQYGNALLSRLPILVSDVHRLPGGGEPRSALRTMVELDGGALWVTATHLTTGRSADRAAQVAALAALHTELDGDRRRGGRLQHRPDAPELARAARAVHRRLGAGRPSATTGPGWRFWQQRRRRDATRRARRTGGSTRCGSTPGVEVPRRRSLDGGGASDHLPLWSTCWSGVERRVARRVRRSRAPAGAG